MNISCRQFIIGLATLILSGAVCAEEITPDGALKLMEECQKQREKNIAPLREQAVEDCVANRGRDREYCESYNRTFGNATPRAGGGMVPGMFWELPVCEEAVAAEKYFKMNPGSRTYNS
jgi:hypothetical protein